MSVATTHAGYYGTMAKKSAGILPYRYTNSGLEVLLVHPGGPFWARKDIGAWSVAKGEYANGENAFDAARREFSEETGHTPPGPFLELTPVKQPSGKVISVWATPLDWDPAALVSNTFRLKQAAGSGQWRDFPEVDRAAWFPVAEALRRILPGQRVFIEELAGRLVGAA